MVGITDRPFRQLCKEMGAAMTVSEMTPSDPTLREHPRTKLRLDYKGETGIRSVQIVGTEPEQMAYAAQLNEESGAQIIDINMGCPAKKVCSVAAGSALLRDEPRVQAILNAIVSAVNIPVTLKFRTGWDPENKNATTIANIAEQAGITALALHGRTRECKYKGHAEYDTIKAVKQSVNIPVFANGDITSPEKARFVLEYTHADGLLIGRGAQGRPWIFREIQHFLSTGKQLPPMPLSEVRTISIRHISSLHNFYGSKMGVKIARKHIGWYCQYLSPLLLPEVKKSFQLNEPLCQLNAINDIFDLAQTIEKVQTKAA
ncbi:MAG: tRNA dihydrouridine synthase DusB [Cycloclasticus sp. symbiont of Poecilosclerida sp. M]|nr:MAG: tRNA dihydrouridine synthase DusB [Cycloclasticus sp. symbiont of Poecilosclerida sp. M]